jgi:hypothetical protein
MLRGEQVLISTTNENSLRKLHNLGAIPIYFSDLL